MWQAPWLGVLLLSGLCVASVPLSAAPPDLSTTAPADEQVPNEPDRSPIENLEALIAEGRYADAERGARDLLARVEVEAGPDSPEAAEVLHLLVNALRRGGKGTEDETVELADRALSIREAILGPGHPLVAQSLKEKSNVLSERGEYSACEPLLLRALQIYQNSLGFEDPNVAAIHSNLGNLYRDNAQLEKSREHLARALQIYEAVSGPTSIDVADALNDFSNVVADSGDLGEAERLSSRALAIRQEMLGPEHPSVATSLNNLGYLKWELGEYEAGRPLMEQAIAIREQALGPDHPHLGDSLHNLALLLLDLGELDRAEESFQRAISIYESASHWHLCASLNSYALLLSSRGDLVSARQLFERTLTILERVEGPESPRIGMTLGNLGEVYTELGEYDRARESLERAAAILEKSLGAEHHTVGIALGDLSEMEVKAGNLAEARQLSERALAVTEKSLGTDHPWVATELERLGQVLRQSGDYSRARIAYERALEIRKEAFGGEHPAYAQTLDLLADLSVESGDCHEALPRYRRAVGVIDMAYGRNHFKGAVGRQTIAECLARTGGRLEAFDMALRAEDVLREHLQLTLTGLAERVGLQYAATRKSGLDLALSLLVDDTVLSTRRGFDALIRSRALVLDEMAERRRRVSAATDSNVTRLAEQLASARNRLAFLTVQGPSEPEQLSIYQRLLSQARADRDRAERKLAEKSRSFRLRGQRKRAGLEEVAAALPPNSGLVGYARFERLLFDRSDADETARVERVPFYLAFVLTRQQENPKVVPLGDAEEIEKLVNRLRNQISQAADAPEWGDRLAEAAYRKDAGTLRRRIWDPIEALLSGVQRLFVVPDGALHLVSLAALPVGATEYVVERGPQIHYLSTERELVAERTASIGEGLLALGNPDFDEPNLFAALAPAGETALAPIANVADADLRIYRGRQSGCASLQTLLFEELTGTEEEVRDVIDIWNTRNEARSQRDPKAVRPIVADLMREKASETAFKLTAPGRQYLHLATHGFFLDRDCPSPEVAENPLLRTGLIMAGANHRQAASPDEDDGILTAEEIATLDLRGVKLAVLSACETGLGEVRTSEGVFGLRRAFGVAGVKSVIMSLWRVEDEPTREWMRALYERHFVDGLGTAEAVQRADLEILQRRREAGLSTHPFYWAGFVASGDWR